MSFFRNRRRQPLNHLPSLSEPFRRDFHGLLTLGSGEALQERAWRWRFATEPAAKRRNEGRLPSQSPPSESTTPEELSRTSSPPSSLRASPRASPRTWRDASSESRLQRKRSWKKHSAEIKEKKRSDKEKKIERQSRRQLRSIHARSLSSLSLLSLSLSLSLNPDLVLILLLFLSLR